MTTMVEIVARGICKIECPYASRAGNAGPCILSCGQWPRFKPHAHTVLVALRDAPKEALRPLMSASAECAPDGDGFTITEWRAIFDAALSESTPAPASGDAA